MKKALLLLTIASALVTVSCKKDTPAPPPILGKWSVEKTIFYYFENGQTTRVDTSVTNMMGCEKDDFTVYLADGKGYFSNGDSLCVGEQPVVDSFRYTLSSDNTRLTTIYTFNGNPRERTTRLKSLTPQEMIRVDTLMNFGNGYFSTAETYSRKRP